MIIFNWLGVGLALPGLVLMFALVSVWGDDAGAWATALFVATTIAMDLLYRNSRREASRLGRLFVPWHGGHVFFVPLWLIGAALFALLGVAGLAATSPGGEEGLSILGVRPGMTRAEVEQVLGPGTTRKDDVGVESTQYGAFETRDIAHSGERWATVVWEGDRVEVVAGSHLEYGGRTLLGRGCRPAEVEEVLGLPAPDEGVRVFAEEGIGMAAKGGRLRSFQLY